MSHNTGLFGKETGICVLLLAFLLSAILGYFMRPAKEQAPVTSKDENLLDFVDIALDSGIINEDDAMYLSYLIYRSEEIISSRHFMSADLASILKRFEKLAKIRGLGKMDIFVLLKTLEVNLRYINFSQNTPVLFERFFDPSLSFPFVYIEDQGFNFHPINALNYATELLEYKKDFDGFVEVMRDLLLFIEEERFGDLNFGVLKLYFAWEKESIPWISSISQGIGCAYFAIAYLMTGEGEFERAARLLANSFQVPIEMGGFRLELDSGPLYLEYSNAPYDLVLNGFMLSLKGLWIYSQIIQDPAALNAFYAGIGTLESLLPIYDLGYWSAYSIFLSQNSKPKSKHEDSKPNRNMRIASETYHRLHVRLLYFLERASKSPILGAYMEKWEDYLEENGLEPEIERAKEEYEFFISIISSNSLSQTKG